MIKRAPLFLITVLVGLYVVSSFINVTQAAPIGYRLPFVGSYGITNAPGCNDTHQARSAEAIDFSTPNGTGLIAVEAGEVVYSADGWHEGFGNLIIIRHDDGLVSWYAHLSERRVSEGNDVPKGYWIGRSGYTGNVRPPGLDGSHLHFEVRRDWSQNNIYSGQSINIRDLPGITWASSCTGLAEGPLEVTFFDFPHYVSTGVLGSFTITQSGFHNLPSGFDNKATSLVLPPDWKITVYEGANRQGRQKILDHTDEDFSNDFFDDPLSLGPLTINEQVSSVDISNNACSTTASTQLVQVNTLPACPVPTPTPIPGSTPPPYITSPDTSISTKPNSCSTNPARFTFTGSDDRTAANALEYAYKLDGGSWSAFTTNSTVQFDNLSTGSHAFTVKAKDQAGNEDPSPAQYTFEIDATPPSTSLSLTGTQGNHGWYRSSVTATLTATDIGCGSTTIRTEYSKNGTDWTAYTSPISFDQEGRHNLAYRSIDGVGNIESTHTTQINIDWTPPVTTGQATGPRDINGIFRDAVTIKLEVSDNLSGKDYSEYSRDGGTTWPQLQGSNDSFVIDGSGVSRFLYRSIDMAGNQENTKDSGPIIINKYLVFSNNAACGLRITATTTLTINGDLHSNGCAQITYNTGGTITGSIRTVGGNNTIAGNTNVQLPPLQTGVSAVPMLQYPLSFYEQQATVIFPTTLIVDSVNTPINGIIYAKGDIDLSAVKLSGSASFIAERDITDVTTDSTFQTGDPSNGVLLFAGRHIMLSSTGNRNLGLLYAPNGTATIGSTNFNLRGSIVADQVNINGATTFDLRYDAAFASSTHILPVSNMLLVPPPSSLPPLPATPSLLSPVGTTGVKPSTGLSWQASTGAIGYQVQVATASSFAPSATVVDIARFDTYHRASLAAGTQYYWRVRAINQAGLGTWSTVANFTTAAPTPTPTPTPIPTPTPTPVPGTNLLINGGFELDANSDTRPDTWTSDTRVTRSNAVVHGGSYAMKHYATNNSGYTINQTINNLTAGARYNFSGWVNIPPTNDGFMLRVEVKWRDANNNTTGSSTIKSYTVATNGWNQATSSLVAPSRTTNVQVQMVVSSLNATIYTDDFEFKAQ